MGVECSSAIAPSYDGPYCSSLHLPPCTYKQYVAEAQALHNALPGVSVNVMDVEEHLAHDYGCGISAALVPKETPALVAMTVAYGIFVPLVFIVAGMLIYVRLQMETPCTP